MTDEEIDVMQNKFRGKLSKHFTFLPCDKDQMNIRNKICCIHCKRVFIYHGSNTSLTYHVKHKHPQEYQLSLITDKEQFSNFLSWQSDRPVSDKVAMDLRYGIIKYILSSGLTTAIVENEEFQTLLGIALRKHAYKLPSRATFDTSINEMYYKRYVKLTENLKSIESIAITADFWTACNDEPYYGITGHWLDSEWNLASTVLGCVNVESKYTSDEFNSIINQTFSSWNITKKTSYVVRDIPMNMVSEKKKSECTHIPCIAHCIQHSILAGLHTEESSNLLIKCRNLVLHLKDETINTPPLKDSDENVSSSQFYNFQKLHQDVETCWNSTYMMLLSLQEAKYCIIEFNTNSQKNSKGPYLSESDWEKLSKYISVLSVIDTATEYVGSYKYTPCSTVLPFVAFLNRILATKNDDPRYISKFKAAILKAFTKRIYGIDGISILQMSVALDPRYKKMTFLSEEKRHDVWNALSIEFQRFYDKNLKNGSSNVSENTLSHYKTKSSSSNRKLTLLMNGCDTNILTEDSCEDIGSKVELDRYRGEAPIPETNDPLMWWKLNDNRFPSLSIFAKTILCVPATSVPCERLFSSSGYMANKMRSCMLPESLNQHVCLRDWLK